MHARHRVCNLSSPNLHCILGKGNQLFKFVDKFRYLGTENLRQDFLIENSSANMEFLENKNREITAREHLLSFFFNWDFLHPRLNSHFKAWTYKKKRHKKIKAYRKFLQKEPTVNRCLLILNLKDTYLYHRSKESII